MKNLLPAKALTVFMMVVSCTQHSPQHISPPSDQLSPGLEKNYFPISEYIRGQIQDIDSQPLRLIYYHTQNERTDTSFISSIKFSELAQEFLPVELSPAGFQQNYNEVSFFDQTTNCYTFTYSPKINRLGLQRVDVLAALDQGKNKVKTIFMQETYNRNDTVIQRKLLWNAKRSFQIITLNQPPNRLAVKSQIMVVWDNQQ